MDAAAGFMTTAMARLGSMDAEDGLAARVVAGEGDVFEQLVAAEHGRVRRLAHRLLGWNADVEDVVQEVFVTAFEQMGKFEGRASLSTWLTAITLNKCRTHRKRRQSRWRVLWGWWERNEGNVAEHSGAGAERDEVSGQVRKAIESLSQADREVIVLHYLEHVEVAEIAAILGVKRNAVEVRLHRARARLREKLGAMGVEGA